jgi:beta-phosphoglucomutase
MINSVVFDFDGVLADTEGLHLRAFQDVFAEHGWALDERAYFETYLGYDDLGLVRAYARNHALALVEPDVRRLVDAKGHAFARYLEAGDLLYPGARACVERMASRFSLAIASGAMHGEIVTILEAGGLLSYFPIIVAADDVALSKPSPEPYVAAARKLGISPAACVAIEDSRGGLTSALGAGMRTIGITTTSSRQALAEAHHIVTSLDEVTVALVERLIAT